MPVAAAGEDADAASGNGECAGSAFPADAIGAGADTGGAGDEGPGVTSADGTKRYAIAARTRRPAATDDKTAMLLRVLRPGG
jgi:hypothetical protein